MLIFFPVLMVVATIFSRPAPEKDSFCEEFEQGTLSCSCSIVKNDIEFCVAFRTVMDGSDTKIVVDDRLRNLGKTQLRVPLMGGAEDRYQIEVVDVMSKKRLISRKDAAKAAEAQKVG